MNAGYEPRLLALGPNYHEQVGSDECSLVILRFKSSNSHRIFVLANSRRSAVYDRGEYFIYVGC